MYWDVNERVIDELLRDRFRSDLEFRSFALSHILRQSVASLGVIECVSAKVGVSRPNGETDVEVSLSHASGPTVLLIENKISAFFQPKQIERYLEHAMSLGRHARVIVVAPLRYLLDAVHGRYNDIIGVSYEDLQAWLKKNSEIDPSRALAADILGRGIAKANDSRTRSGHIESDPSTESLFEGMMEICAADLTLPPLKMKTNSKASTSGGVRSRGSYELCFDLPGWESLVITDSGRRYFSLNYRFDLKRNSPKGASTQGPASDIQVEFANWALRFDWFMERLRPVLPPHWDVEHRGRRALYLVRSEGVPYLDRNQTFIQQQSKFNAALELLRSIWKWYQDHYNLLVEWAQAAKKQLADAGPAGDEASPLVI